CTVRNDRRRSSGSNASSADAHIETAKLVEAKSLGRIDMTILAADFEVVIPLEPGYRISHLVTSVMLFIRQKRRRTRACGSKTTEAGDKIRNFGIRQARSGLARILEPQLVHCA